MEGEGQEVGKDKDKAWQERGKGRDDSNRTMIQERQEGNRLNVWTHLFFHDWGSTVPIKRPDTQPMVGFGPTSDRQ